jgi:multidrug efflux pump subunit AcrA (membrane-fusion protein)
LLLLPLGCSKPPPTAPPPPEVSVAVVVQKSVKDWDEYTGRMQAIENVEVRPRVSGYIDKIEFTQGKLVKEGDLLVRIDPRPYQAIVDSAMAQLAPRESRAGTRWQGTGARRETESHRRGVHRRSRRTQQRSEPGRSQRRRRRSGVRFGGSST